MGYGWIGNPQKRLRIEVILKEAMVGSIVEMTRMILLWFRHAKRRRRPKSQMVVDILSEAMVKIIEVFKKVASSGLVKGKVVK